MRSTLPGGPTAAGRPSASTGVYRRKQTHHAQQQPRLLLPPSPSSSSSPSAFKRLPEDEPLLRVAHSLSAIARNLSEMSAEIKFVGLRANLRWATSIRACCCRARSWSAASACLTLPDLSGESAEEGAKRESSAQQKVVAALFDTLITRRGGGREVSVDRRRWAAARKAVGRAAAHTLELLL